MRPPSNFPKESKRQDADREAEVKELHAKIGQLTIEIGKRFSDYNWDRPHSTLPDDKTPMEVYNESIAA